MVGPCPKIYALTWPLTDEAAGLNFLVLNILRHFRFHRQTMLPKDWTSAAAARSQVIPLVMRCCPVAPNITL